MALHSELPIYKVAYDLCDYAVDLVRNMPRDVKSVIGGELRDQCLALVVRIFRANVARDKVVHLTDLIERLQVAELLLRLLRQASHSHGDRAELANLLRRRGFSVDRTFTKTYRISHG